MNEVKESIVIQARLELWNRKGSQDTFFIKIAEAKDLDGEEIDLELEATAIGFNTNSFKAIATFLTDKGGSAFATLELTRDPENKYVGKDNVERIGYNYRLISNDTDAVLKAYGERASKSFMAKTATKNTSFAKKKVVAQEETKEEGSKAPDKITQTAKEKEPADATK